MVSTMGWELAGFEVARGGEVHAPDPGPEARAWAEAAAAAVGDRFGVRRKDAELIGPTAVGVQEHVVCLVEARPEGIHGGLVE